MKFITKKTIKAINWKELYSNIVRNRADKYRTARKKWLEKNPNYKKEYYAKNIIRISEKRSEYYQKNKEKIKAYNRERYLRLKKLKTKGTL